MAHILVVDDEEKMRRLLAMMLTRKNHRVDTAGDGAEALVRIRETPFDLIISDIKMPELDGTTLLQRMKSEGFSCPVVFITAFATVDSAVESMRAGAADYITKPFEESRIHLTVERTLNISRIMAENRDLKQKLKEAAAGEEIVYTSKAMADLMELALKVARSDTAVLISGESGTGKELLARFIHRQSAHAEGRFVPVNCAAISATLVESELFGHEKGAFTGADRQTEGRFEFATGGTLFLDEIGDLPAEAQAKLLRALQEKKVQRVGGNDEISVDVRVICATNRDIDTLVESGKFRRDLYYRINVFPLRPPPLRERPADIPLLADHFIGRLSGGRKMEITDGAKRLLHQYRWPGNVRELANAMERAYILAREEGVVTAETLSFLHPKTASETDETPFRLPPSGIDLEAVESDFVRQALAASDGNQSAAARLLGLSRGKFRMLLKQANREG